MTADDARSRFAAARVARLATLGGSGARLVPICFVAVGDVIWSAVDAKPKATRALARLRDIERDPRVTLLADHYEDEDWSRLWWVRAEGVATVLPEPAPPALVERYAQYRDAPPAGPVVRVEVRRWSGWAAAEVPGDGD